MFPQSVPSKVFSVIFLFGFATVAFAQTFTHLVEFGGRNGSAPEYGALVQGTDGNFYGTTSFGGDNKKGTVFQMTPVGRLTSLYNFCLQSGCPDGSSPLGGLAIGTEGNFYGITFVGGSGTACPGGCGTVFKITSAGVLSTLHSFNSTDGAHPLGTLLLARNGSFYGTTDIGGASNAGTIFKITPAGTFTTVYNFCSQANCADGLFPVAGLIQGNDGNLYGTTGGSDSLNGTAFRMTPSGNLQVTHTFCPVGSSCSGGSYSVGTLVQGTDGNFYGTTYYGGQGFGTVYRITPGGVFTTMHEFDEADGESPIAGLIEGTDGNFYGTTIIGGLTSSGTIYQMTPKGQLTTLYSLFCESEMDCSDGANPYASLVQGTDGHLYGTTFNGGDHFGAGTVFSMFVVGLGPNVRTLPNFGKVGATVQILGTGLTGASNVTFNGVAATFTVVSDTEITATVPTGASTGSVQVTVSGVTLSSNGVFRVK